MARIVANDDSVVADVSETLRLFMQNGLARLMGSPSVLVHNLRTNPPLPSLTLFLFDLQEDPGTRNRPRERVAVGNTYQMKKPDLSLMLRYLITPWIIEEPYAYPYTDQVILARVAQLFYDEAIVSGLDLFGTTLQDKGISLKVQRSPLSLEDQTRIWHTLQKPYRLSYVYEVKVATIRPETFDLVSQVSSRALDHAQAGGVSP